MAIAEKHLASVFNKENYPVVDHYTYCILGDGCMMEGISHEVCSLAGTLKLGKLIAFYDDNGISIDGHVEGWFTDAACTKAWDSSSPVNEDITVYAKFTAIENGGDTEPGTSGGCNSAIFGGIAVLSVGLVAAAVVLLKRRNRI